MRSDSLVSEGKVTVQRIFAGTSDWGSCVPIHLHIEVI